MRVIGPFEIGEVLARGGHAAVHVATWPEHPEANLVAKVASPGHELLLHRENSALREVEHPGVIAPTAFVDDATHAALLLPRAVCSLRAHVGRLDEHEVAHVATATSDALAALHRAGIAHNDVTAGNILLMADGSPVLADFGSTTRCTPDAARGDVASLARAALESLAPAENGAIRAVLSAAAETPRSASALADALRSCGVEPRRPDARAVAPIRDEPPTMTLG
ncbi:MAG TPA: protein kinase [Acidimicrobiales bacterium]